MELNLSDTDEVFACPVCQHADCPSITPTFRVPKHNLVRYTSRESALNAESRQVRYHCCPLCAFVFNSLFDPVGMYDGVDYESGRSNSSVFSRYLSEAVAQVAAAFCSSGMRVVEVGCGDGQFLTELAQTVKIEAHGFDPSAPSESNSLVHFHRELISSLDKINPDLFILRHVLEHIPAPVQLLKDLLENKKPDIYLEIPSFGWIARRRQFLAISNEHCSYFGPASLKCLIEKLGYEKFSIKSSFEEEYLQGFLGTQIDNAITSFDASIEFQENVNFGRHVSKIIDFAHDELKRNGDSLVVWGAGGKGTLLLNLLEISSEQIKFVVDGNPRRHGTYLPVCGQQVIAANQLVEIAPEKIILTNSAYQDEIRATLNELNLYPEIICFDKLLSNLTLPSVG